jgi:1-acyl-sn-glycerol-3-phosphate acyltransferase
LNTINELDPESPVTKIATVTSQVSPWVAFLAYPIGRYGLMPCYFQHITVTGRDHLPTIGPVIIAPTHRSRWDALVVPYAAGRDITGRHLRFMVSVNEIKGLQGWFIRHLGGYPIDTEHPAIASLRHSIVMLRNNETLVVFPEGGDLDQNRLQPLNQLQPGLARMALQAESTQPGLGVQIVPMSIKYNPPIPRWRCRIEVKIGAPLQVATYLSKSPKQSGQALTLALETALRQLQDPV